MASSSSAVRIEQPPHPADAAIRVDQLSKVYRLYSQPQDRLKEMFFGRLGRRYSRDFWALRDVSFELGRGQRLGVIGRNGSGKSTLLQILAGTLTPTSGSVAVTGRVAALLELGSGFHPDYTGRENIYVNASILGLSQEETDDRFDAIAAFADIGEFLDQPVKTYSSGMFVRVAFAVAASVDADVLLIDEALAVGDVFFTQKCYRRLHDLVERGVSVVFVSHDTTSVSQFCTSVIVLEHGHVAYFGDPVTGIRTYFNLQRRGPVMVSSDSTFNDKEQKTDGLKWPSAEAIISVEGITHIGDGAHCTAVAICDERGQACRHFQMGDTALFFFEFTLAQDIQSPVGGVEIFNERHIVVHGKNSLQYDVHVPASVSRGSRVRFCRKIVLDVAPGEYTVALGFATCSAEVLASASSMSYSALSAQIHVLSVASQVSSFSVMARQQGQALVHHGLCNLPGDMQCAILPPAESSAHAEIA